VRLSFAAVAAVAVFVWPSPASASRVSVREVCGPNHPCFATDAFEADPGEANRLTVTQAGGQFIFRDDRAVVTPGDGCSAVDTHQVSCIQRLSPSGQRQVTVDTDDGDDTVTVDIAFRALVRGGPGRDVLIMRGSTRGTVDGGPGRDVIKSEARRGQLLDGGAGDDRVTGGRDNDVIEDLYGGNDVLVGGPGNDNVIAGPGKDTVVGGAGGDDLSGDEGGDTLLGGTGNDRLRGGDGRDALLGGTGRDRFIAGSGSDRITARDGLPEHVACGSGRDRVRADRRDRLFGCELRLTT
jgi:hypothetical protein